MLANEISLHKKTDGTPTGQLCSEKKPQPAKTTRSDFEKRGDESEAGSRSPFLENGVSGAGSKSDIIKWCFSYSYIGINGGEARRA